MTVDPQSIPNIHLLLPGRMTPVTHSKNDFFTIPGARS